MFVWPYSHPPYSIQEDMMRAIGGALEEAKSGVFESPTGTGKSRSILCSVVPWLLNNLEKKKRDDVDGGDEPSWITEYANEQSAQTQQRLDFLRKQRETRVKLLQKQQHREKKTKLDEDDDSEEMHEHRAEELEAFAPLRKVYFCSRTHTQLAQFAGELRKINALLPQPVSCVILGSRTQLCVNEDLKQKHSNAASLNDACLDLNDTKAKCPFNSSEAVDWLADYTLNTDLPDLEDLTNKHTCAYYASRQAARSAQIVLLPYSSILNQETRTTLEIDLQGNVVVFDEAHNLVEAVADAYSTQITFSQLETAIQDITNYVQKYDRLNLDTKNLLLQLSTLIMPKLMQCKLSSGEEVVWTVNQFLTQIKLQDFNFLPLLSKVRELKLNRKLKAVSTSQVTILSVLSFLHAVANNFDTGRIKVTPQTCFRFFLLDIATKFTEIVDKAHSVLLCGGTMHPVEQVISQLFPNNQQEVVRFSCEHVIPQNNLAVLQISTSPARPNTELLFTHAHDLFEDLNASLRNLCAVCPQGMVVFFPSYSMLERFIAAQPRVYKKPLVVETRQGNENAFHTYEQQLLVNKTDGAILFAVVGGRLSEGINFSDHLARCIVMIGLPFPNRNEVEMREKMLFHEQQFGPGAGNRYLENQCWKSVNQSIGRAIRHAKDFALVVLLDVRFATTQGKLPAWIGTRFERCEGWGQVMRQANLFFKPKF